MGEENMPRPENMEKQLSFVSLNGSFFLPCLSFQEKFKDINEVIIS
jgi:hypothetical protein